VNGKKKDSKRMEGDREQFVKNRARMKKRECANRIELSCMEKEGRYEKQANFCRRPEMENCWSNDSMYLLLLHKKEKEIEKERRWEEERSEEDDAGAHLLLAHNRGGKER